MNRPTFDELPGKDEPQPYKSAWGLYGPGDELGTLNLLTRATTLAAVKEVVYGIMIPLNLPLNVPVIPMNPARKAMRHRINEKGHANDDEININTQSSSHWDGLRHYPYQATKQYYNGVIQEEIISTARLGIHNIANKPIVARAVLLDFRAWATSQGITYSAFTTYGITVSQLEAVAACQRVKLVPGDVLIIRSGWTEDYLAMSPADQAALGERSQRAFVGVEQSEELLRWHWDHEFSAVAGDTNAYEAWPPDGLTNRMGCESCHEVFLSGWGIPIGELWDLEELARECRRKGKWSFMLMSQPLGVIGGVASPANVMAVL